MIDVITADKRYHKQLDWLSARWLFSFGDYHDPNNLGWGPLRVFNDDVIQPGGGFPMHPHRDMEIITYVLDGELQHRDSMGNEGTVRPGEIQVMSAGSGVRHSEFNPNADTPTHLMQIWIHPREAGRTPSWGQQRFTPDQRSGGLLKIVGPHENGAPLTIDQDAQVYAARIEAGQTVSHAIGSGRLVFFYLIDGAADVNNHALNTGDQARVRDEQALAIHATADSEVILLDLPGA